MSKHLVLGAGGFIGKHLVEALAQQADSQVVAFGRFSQYRDSTPQPFDTLQNVTLKTGDFLNRDDLDTVLEGVDYVFHLISSTNPAVSSNDPFIDIDTNVRGSVNLFELCVKHNVKKVIFLSSGGTVYGDIRSESISEDMVPQPRSPYGIGKLTIENYLRYFKFTNGLDYVVYRVANPYGPGQNIHGKQGVVPIFMHKFLEHQPVTIYGDGSMVRDYLYIDDLIQLIMRSYPRQNQHSEYNLGSGQGISINDIFDNIQRCTGYSVEKNHLDAPATFVHKSVLDISRYVGEFGAYDFTSLEKGMENTWDYVKQLG
jgi:UDP-glucose 4-epimerase